MPPPSDNDSCDNFPVVAFVKVGILNPAVKVIVKPKLLVSTAVTVCIVLKVSASLFSVPSI